MLRLFKLHVTTVPFPPKFRNIFSYDMIEQRLDMYTILF